MSGRIAVPANGYSDTPAPAVRTTRNLTEILNILETRRLAAATAYACLDPRIFSQTTGYVANSPGQPALLLHAGGSPGASLYALGPTAGILAILREVSVPRYSYITYEAAHEHLIKQHFVLHGVQPLARMAVSSSTFRPIPSPATALGPIDLGQANALYRSGGGAPISQRYLNEGKYFGIWEGEKLVSIAGTQLISERHGIAVVANVFTHPSYRNKGYATQCVGTLTGALLASVPDVVLNVDPENTPAVRSYTRLGYTEQCRLAEAWAVWKGRSALDKILRFLYDWLIR